MGRPKGSKNKAEKKSTDPNVDDEYEETITFNCPVRGKVKQKVKVKKLKPATDGFTQPVSSNEDALAEIEGDDNGLTIYDETEDGN